MQTKQLKHNKKRFPFSQLGLAAALIPLTLNPQQALAMLTIVVSGTVDMNFGTMSEGGAGGTVIIDTAGSRSVTGSVNAITGAGLESQAFLSVAGSTGLPMDISMTNASFAVSNGTSTMQVDNFNLVTVAGGATNTITLATNPSTFPLGARLTVNAGQAQGAYSGTYTVSVNYQ